MQPAQQAEPPREEHQPQAAPSSGADAQQQQELQQEADPAHLAQDIASVPHAETEGQPSAAEHQQDSQVRQRAEAKIADRFSHHPAATCACMRVYARASPTCCMQG